MSDNNPSNTVLPNLCDWCGKPVALSIQHENTVCSRCYQILITAGLSDEKIFEKAIYKNGLLASS